jgi:hypothetical protein
LSSGARQALLLVLSAPRTASQLPLARRRCCCADAYPHAYLTAAAAIGTTPEEVEELERRLDKCFAEFRKKQGRA